MTDLSPSEYTSFVLYIVLCGVSTLMSSYSLARHSRLFRWSPPMKSCISWLKTICLLIGTKGKMFFFFSKPQHSVRKPIKIFPERKGRSFEGLVPKSTSDRRSLVWNDETTTQMPKQSLTEGLCIIFDQNIYIFNVYLIQQTRGIPY